MADDRALLAALAARVQENPAFLTSLIAGLQEPPPAMPAGDSLVSGRPKRRTRALGRLSSPSLPPPRVRGSKRGGAASSVCAGVLSAQPAARSGLPPPASFINPRAPSVPLPVLVPSNTASVPTSAVISAPTLALSAQASQVPAAQHTAALTCVTELGSDVSRELAGVQSVLPAAWSVAPPPSSPQQFPAPWQASSSLLSSLLQTVTPGIMGNRNSNVSSADEPRDAPSTEAQAPGSANSCTNAPANPLPLPPNPTQATLPDFIVANPTTSSSLMAHLGPPTGVSAPIAHMGERPNSRRCSSDVSDRRYRRRSAACHPRCSRHRSRSARRSHRSARSRSSRWRSPSSSEVSSCSDIAGRSHS
ncbi:protein PRRC2C-like [Bufo gargarizans]|uniref:protein PRRC2C-like n=1 Tax=Bufo gargarizans TaxID=30331 RepID=UPI001CF32594|nr:protein PRRC2C-like [Bufo gargarizans]